MRRRRVIPARMVKLGTDTVEQLRAAFPGRTIDAAVRELLRLCELDPDDPTNREQSVNRLAVN